MGGMAADKVSAGCAIAVLLNIFPDFESWNQASRTFVCEYRDPG